MRSTLGQVAQDCGGVLVGGASDESVKSVVIDSRSVSSGSLFVALPGERVDGREFAASAMEAGAAGVLTAGSVAVPHVLVDDAVRGLGALAAAYRRRLDAVVIGVTGSVGKTGTKDLLAALLSRLGPTVAPPGSYNNDIGLPLTVLSADESTRYLVLEMGARATGDIDKLCAIAAPQIGLVLNVGRAHLGEFGSRAAIAAAKGELVDNATDLAVLNAADPFVAAMAARARGAVRTFGRGGDVRAEQIQVAGDGRPSFRLSADGGDAPVRLRLVGAHQVSGALAAATVALAAGLGIDAVADALSATEPVSRWRMEVHDRADGVTVLNDAYNANPESMRAALDALVAMSKAGRTSWAVLGAMLELGPTSDSEHADIGTYAAELGVDRVVAIGATSLLADTRRDADAAVNDVQEAAELLSRQLQPGDIVLVKASRGAGLERLADILLANDVARADTAVGENPHMRGYRQDAR